MNFFPQAHPWSEQKCTPQQNSGLGGAGGRPYGLSDVYKRSSSLIQHRESNHSFTALYHSLRPDITSRNKRGIFLAPWNMFIVNDRNSSQAQIIIHRNTTGSYADTLQYHNNPGIWKKKTLGLGKESERNLMQNRNKGHTKVSHLEFLFNIQPAQRVFYWTSWFGFPFLPSGVWAWTGPAWKEATSHATC